MTGVPHAMASIITMAERLRPIDRAWALPSVFLPVVHLADELYIVLIEEGLHSNGAVLTSWRCIRGHCRSRRGLVKLKQSTGRE